MCMEERCVKQFYRINCLHRFKFFAPLRCGYSEDRDINLETLELLVEKVSVCLTLETNYISKSPDYSLNIYNVIVGEVYDKVAIVDVLVLNKVVFHRIRNFNLTNGRLRSDYTYFVKWTFV